MIFSLKTYKNQLQSLGVLIQFHICRMVKTSESITITLNLNDSEANENKISTRQWHFIYSYFSFLEMHNFWYVESNRKDKNDCIIICIRLKRKYFIRVLWKYRINNYFQLFLYHWFDSGHWRHRLHDFHNKSLCSLDWFLSRLPRRWLQVSCWNKTGWRWCVPGNRCW